MGKHKHSKDKLHLLQSEYAAEWGGYKSRKLQLPFKSLPFYCCGLSLRPFRSAVCTPEGTVFDPEFLLPYLRRYRRNPVTGKPLSASDLITLHFYKNAAGEFHCPVTFRVFSSHSHIVANKRSGNVYSYEAIDRLCRKPRQWTDLLTGEPFTHRDLVDIQNPADAKNRCIANFFHLQQREEAGGESAASPAAVEGIAAEERSLQPVVKKTPFMEKVLAAASHSEAALRETHRQLRLRGPRRTSSDATAAGDAPPLQQQQQDAATSSAEESGQQEARSAASSSSSSSSGSGVGYSSRSSAPKKETPAATHSLYTTHRMAAGFTSTVVDGSSQQEYRPLTEREKMQPIYDRCKKLKKKGYLRMVTTQGFLNIELHADIAPRACDSFLRLCAAGYYTDTIFHRCIKNFMIQGGRAELREPAVSSSSSSSATAAVPAGSQPAGDLRHCRESRSGFPGGLPFENECSDLLKHQGIGILSMANSGQKRSNLSEFFITFKSCEHLNNKHTIFGRVVGGLDVLRQWEKLQTNKKDQPLIPPKIVEMKIYTNPFEEAAREIEEEKQQQLAAEKKKQQDASKPWFNNRDAFDETASHPQRYANTVGKYLPANLPALAGATAASKEKKRPPADVSSSSSSSSLFASASNASSGGAAVSGVAAAPRGKTGVERGKAAAAAAEIGSGREENREEAAAAAVEPAAPAAASVPSSSSSSAAEGAGESNSGTEEAATAAERAGVMTAAAAEAEAAAGRVEESQDAAQKKKLAAAALILAAAHKGAAAPVATAAAAAAAAKKRSQASGLSEYSSVPQRVKLPRRTFDFSAW